MLFSRAPYARRALTGAPQRQLCTPRWNSRCCQSLALSGPLAVRFPRRSLAVSRVDAPALPVFSGAPLLTPLLHEMLLLWMEGILHYFVMGMIPLYRCCR
jgi:hypothetical protein